MRADDPAGEPAHGRPVMIGLTITRYFAWRFMRTILAIFFTILCLMFVVIFVEMLRRASDNPQAGAGVVALMTAMKVPAAAEMILPFAVLFGSMATFVDLTQKLELIVARAAGMSVWQFITPPVLTALLIGIVSVTIYNPLSAEMKQRSDQMELELFGVPGSVRIDHGVWLRQHGVDGLAVIHAMDVSNGGIDLSAVSVNIYSSDGGFVERVEAASAHLEPGVWVLKGATVSAPGEPARLVGSYMLATDLTPEQAAAATTPPQGTPFWSLPEMTERTAEAGLDANGYRLQFQTLLARPLLLVAMVLLAASFSLRFFRFGGIAKTLSGGVVAGFVLYVLTKVLSDLGGAGMISPLVAAWSPALVGSMLGTLTLLYSEDG
jgi:lipopolysaccharide export system permease protein